ncbi:MAG TPA: AIR synthase-related protein [Candidatus Omnitrophota bacterium]|nr:AIR synthase-related protein [Candidatus Omnitrophota bacterium]
MFDRVQDQGRVPREDMYKTFNMGIGMVLVVRPQDAVPVRNFLARRRLKTYVIGEVAKDAKRKLRFLN